MPKLNKIGILMVNLGTPESPTKPAVKRYLKEFLWDRRVVEIPRLVWWFILNLIILNTRPSKSAALYKKIWLEQGSPLLVFSAELGRSLQQDLNDRYPNRFRVEIAMRYGSPSIQQGMKDLKGRSGRPIPDFTAIPTILFDYRCLGVRCSFRGIENLAAYTNF